jgi:hypothetical protein
MGGLNYGLNHYDIVLYQSTSGLGLYGGPQGQTWHFNLR